ncbi:arylsulfatase [Portibacter lacus]|uniref:N-acetylgalactosamine-6-sulfatase n=1 Tax=Portibacter lacus TaxID=1099794 RepID=A0AA37WF20_9BACT|nr:arylsulfatase [Portibacter lacus]GLR18418.1 N-acetylgalactosamine-6-sulfatase [Portibacter lacus]
MKHLCTCFFLIIIFTLQISAQPNIIIILTDDQGWGDVSFNGNSNLSTPHIDELANNGIIFNRFFVEPVCSPTRAEILTGRYHVRSGVYSTSRGGERMNADEVTIAQILKNNGYKTAIYGKWHNGMQAPYHPNAKGFDDFYGFASGHWGNYFSPMLEHNGKIVQGNGFLADDLTDHAISYIENNKDHPFFLLLSLNTPHSPMQVPQKYWDGKKDKPLAIHNIYPASEDTMFTKAALAMVENIDDNVGRINAKISQLNLEEETIVIFMSDNGPNGVRWNGGMKGKKGSTDEGGVRVPMAMKWKGHIRPGIKTETIASGIDILPTLLDLVGIDHVYSNPIDGISLKSILNENSSEADRYLFQFWQKRTSVRSQYFRLDDQDRLYHMQLDSGQVRDVQQDYPEQYQAMLSAKKDWVDNVASLLDYDSSRPITIGYPGFEFHQIPARDAEFSGNIHRSNRHPNCTFLSNWTALNDEIYWNVDIVEEGDFSVEIFYTCPEEDVGSSFELTCGDARITSKITVAFDPPFTGAINDIYPRMESDTKDFKSMSIGEFRLSKGPQKLSLKALDIPGNSVMDFRLLMLRRVK